MRHKNGEKSERYDFVRTNWSRSLRERHSSLVSDAKESQGLYLKKFMQQSIKSKAVKTTQKDIQPPKI